MDRSGGCEPERKSAGEAVKTKPLMPFQAVTQSGLLPSHDLVEIIDRLHKAAGGSVGSVSWVDVTGKPTFAAVALTGLYGDLIGIPATFAPADHSHAQADVTGLVAALAAKQPAGSYATGAQGALADTASQPGHTHAQADVTGLQAALDAKQGLVLGGVATITLPGWRRSHIQTVAAVGVTPAHRVFATLGAFAATDINNPELLDIAAISVAPGTDQITITAAFASPASGPIPINWSAM